VSFDDGGGGAGAQVDAVTREVQLSFKRLDGEIRAMQQAGGREEDAAVRLQVQRQLAQALFKLSVEFRWGQGSGPGLMGAFLCIRGCCCVGSLRALLVAWVRLRCQAGCARQRGRTEGARRGALLHDWT
jgi:hypothetical protein